MTKQCLIDTWASIPQSVVDEAIDQWMLRPCGKAKVVTLIICYNQLVLFRATEPHNTTGSFHSHPHFRGQDTCLWSTVGLLAFEGNVVTQQWLGEK